MLRTTAGAAGPAAVVRATSAAAHRIRSGCAERKTPTACAPVALSPGTRCQAPRWHPTWPEYSALRKGIYSVHVCVQHMGCDRGIAEEAALDQYGMGISVGTIVLVIAAIAVAVHYRRERRRASLLRNLDHHEWYR